MTLVFNGGVLGGKGWAALHLGSRRQVRLTKLKPAEFAEGLRLQMLSLAWLVSTA